MVGWVDLFQNVRFKFDIAWLVLWFQAQKEVLNLLHTYVVILTLGTQSLYQKLSSKYITLLIDNMGYSFEAWYK